MRLGSGEEIFSQRFCEKKVEIRSLLIVEKSYNLLFALSVQFYAYGVI